MNIFMRCFKIFYAFFSHFLHNFFRNSFFYFWSFFVILSDFLCNFFMILRDFFLPVLFDFLMRLFFIFLVTVCNLQGSSITPISVWKGESFKGHTRFDKWQKTLTVIICQTSKSRNKSQQFFFTFRAFFRCCKLS